MRREWLVCGAALALALGGGACKKSAPSDKGGGGGAVTTKDDKGPSAPALPSVGMADPFARLGGADAVKALKQGYAAMRAKKYDEARDGFHTVVAGAPDYTSARWMELKAAALGGHFADVPALWAELLARDYVAYVGRLDKPKELAPLRAAPEWQKVKELEATYKPQYAAGLDKGFFFVARVRDASPVKFDGGVAKLEQHQEAFFYDTASKTYRRLTETDGHVQAINVSPDRKLLSFLVVAKAQAGDDKTTMLLDPQAGYVDLTTLETVGPFAIKGSQLNVALYFTAKGEPVWEAGDMAYTVDAAHTTLVDVARDGDAASKNVTWASLSSVNHGGKQIAGAKIGADGKSVEVDGLDKPLRAARPLAESTLEWSPDRKKLLYAGELDACKVPAEKNELFLYDAEKKSASRIAQAVSAFDGIWLDADHLVYEGGVGKEGKLHLYEASTRSDATLKPRYGAGLFGYPELSCESESASDDVAQEDGE